MIVEQIVARGVRDEAVVEALRRTPRDLFVPDSLRDRAFEDNPLPIGGGQTISQPYIVGLMSEMLRVDRRHRVLEIGTGSGYQTAVLARLARHVYSAEIVPGLSRDVGERLRTLGLDNVTLATGDALDVFRDEAPFDRILSAAAPSSVPERLLQLLAAGGRCVIPIGTFEQTLYAIERNDDGSVVREAGIPVRFVPMTGSL